MSEFKQYNRRIGFAEARPVTSDEINEGYVNMVNRDRISVSPADIDAGSPKEGDMIARNPENHDDRWLIAKDYWEQNFEQTPIG